MRSYWKFEMLLAVVIVVATWWLFSQSGVFPVENAPTDDAATVEVSTDPAADLEEAPVALPASALITNVPFTAQAPFGEWGDPRQQDACEEASILMAAHWVQGDTSLTASEAREEILKLSATATEMFGTYRDSSAEDTLKLYHAYYGFEGEVVANPTLEEIKAALAAGKLVAVPTDGRKLGNPNYTGVGPDRHFLVILGYDDTTGVFTTHDPGTRSGASYRYRYDVLMNALINYPTGDHKPLFKNDTAMIIFAKA